MTGDGDGARWREILFYQAYCQLRLESERLYVGYLWWPLETMLEMAVLYVVFRGVVQVPGEHYLSFLLCGLVCWRWFAQSVVRAAPSILHNQPLASQVFVPKLVFPVAMLVADAAKFAVGLAVLLLFLCLDGYRPSVALTAFPLVLAVQFLFQTALALWIAALVPFFRSLLVGLDVALRFGMFASGVFFDAARVSDPLRSMLACNPMTLLLDAWRRVLMQGRIPDFPALGAVAAVSILAIAAVKSFVARRERLYPRLPA